MSSLLFILIVLVAVLSAGPLHASCKIQWTFPDTSCEGVRSALSSTIQNLSGDDCGAGEVCRYSLQSSTSTEIKAIHTTPLKKYKDDLTISFDETSPNGQCVATAYSTSEIWYAVLDFGTNYCNLENLAGASGLSYREVTNDAMCTQYSSANCTRF